MPMRRCWLQLCLAVTFACVAGTAWSQDAAEQFFRGKTINLAVGTSPGGGYDTYMRLLARHWAKYIPGHPTVVPQNMPGAGSHKLAGYLYSVAPKDGTAVGAIFPGAILAPLLGDTPLQHDPSKLSYVGSANSDVYMCVVRSESPVKTFADVLTREIIVGATNEGGTTRDMPSLYNSVLGAKFRIVTGYAGTKEITLALERGEVDGLCGFGWTSLNASYPHWIARGTVRILVQENAKGHPELNKMGVPLSVSFAKTDDDRQAMELVYTQAVFGRPYVLPPGVPAERVAALRRAFMQAFADPELLAEAQKIKLDIDPLSGEEVQAMVEKAFALPPRIIERAKQALVYRGPAR
jgi:tripartite-type tricarboxylate transporter receptor subunit TctC